MKTENQEVYSLTKYSEAKDQPVEDFRPSLFSYDYMVDLFTYLNVDVT